MRRRQGSVDVTDRVNALLARKQWAVYDLAVRLGVSEQAVRMWRSGKGKMDALRLPALDALEGEGR